MDLNEKFHLSLRGRQPTSDSMEVWILMLLEFMRVAEF